MVARLDAMKFQVFIHSIGDRGIRTALDAIEYAEQQNGPRDRRYQLVHIECLNPQDIPRFKQLKVVACMQPRHYAPDITGQWAKAVGPARSKYAWAFRSLRDAGATLAFSSDWNVAEMEPVIGIYTALTRKGLANFHNHLRGSPAKPEEVLLLPRLDLGSSPVRAPRATPDCSKDKEWISRF